MWRLVANNKMDMFFSRDNSFNNVKCGKSVYSYFLTSALDSTLHYCFELPPKKVHIPVQYSSDAASAQVTLAFLVTCETHSYFIGIEETQSGQRKEGLKSFAESFELTMHAIDQYPLSHQLQQQTNTQRRYCQQYISRATVLHRRQCRCAYLQIVIEVVERDVHVLAALLELDAGVAGQHKVEVEVVNGSTTRQRQAVDCQLSTVGRLSHTTSTTCLISQPTSRQYYTCRWHGLVAACYSQSTKLLYTGPG